MLKLQKIWNTLLDILFPPICIICKRHLEVKTRPLHMCAECLGCLKRYETLFCPVCQARIPEGKKICHPRSLYLMGAATSYADDSARKLIWTLKYERVRAAALPMAIILAEYVRSLRLPIEEYTIIPIPLHSSRERERGFNQSALLAEHLGQLLSLPIAAHAMIRIRNTTPQAEIEDQEARERNIKECFAIDLKTLPEKTKSILLIDDVSTSGATLNEAVKTLRTAGIKNIIGLVFAKAR